MIKVQILSHKKNQKLYRDFTTEWLEGLFKLLKKEKGLLNKERLNGQELSLCYVSSRKIRRLNRDYRAKDKATDILSFEGDGFFSLGELILSQEEIKKKAESSQLSLKLYTQLLLTHGVLHLLGYDHETLEQEKGMLSLQNKLNRKLAEKLAPRHKKDFDVV